MKKHFKNMIWVIALFVTAVFLAAIPSQEVFAYKYSENLVTDEGDQIVMDMDTPETTVKVVMYMLMQPSYAESAGFRGYYSFECTDGIFEPSSAYNGLLPEDDTGEPVTSNSMIFFFRPDNAVVEDVYHDYQVWLWQFTLEPGTYNFATSNEVIDVLRQDLTPGFACYSEKTDTLYKGNGSSTISAGGEWVINNDVERITVKDGDTVVLFAAFGDKQDEFTHPGEEWAWRYKTGEYKGTSIDVLQDPMETLIEYAKWKKSQEGLQIVSSGESEDDPAEEKPEEQDTNLEEPVQEVVTEAPVLEPKPQLQPSEEQKIKVKKDQKGLIIGIILCVALTGGIFIYVKKRDST